MLKLPVMTAMTRADLHVHSTASEESKLGVQRALGLPECATPPEEVHELAKRRGMDFVTITDHDTIAGALQIADRPDVFVSEELTASFRGEPQQVHVLCYGITPDDHGRLQELASDVEAVAEYLHEQEIACALAHPFYAVAAPLAARHRRRLAELFPIWEVRNGSRASELNLPAAVYIDTHGGIAALFTFLALVWIGRSGDRFQAKNQEPPEPEKRVAAAPVKMPAPSRQSNPVALSQVDHWIPPPVEFVKVTTVVSIHNARGKEVKQFPWENGCASASATGTRLRSIISATNTQFRRPRLSHRSEGDRGLNCAGPALLQVIHLNQAYARATVLTGENRGICPGSQGREDSRFQIILQRQTVCRKLSG